MLAELTIRNIVLIDTLTLTFLEGLTVLSGETGAGKSILLDALGFVLGGRSDSRLLRFGESKGHVIARFIVQQGHPSLIKLDDSGIASDGEIILRRLLQEDGRTRGFINDEPVSVSFLKQIGMLLVEIQGQFEGQGLMNPQSHLALLDSFANLHGAVSQLKNLFQQWKLNLATLQKEEKNYVLARQSEDYIRHNLEELNAFDPQDEEEETLSQKRHQLQHRQKITTTLHDTLELLCGYESIEGKVTQAQRQIERIQGITDVESSLSALDRLSIELTEAKDTIESQLISLEGDYTGLDDVEERLFKLRDLARKHNVHPDTLPSLLVEFKEQIENLEKSDIQLDEIRALVLKKRQAYIDKAQKISNCRLKAAKSLSKAVNISLPELKLENSTFKVDCQSLEKDHWRETGLDTCAFQISTNKESLPGPLAKIASGGERNRLLLAIKVSLIEKEVAPTLIFDEIDSGLGGATASAVGEKLSHLSKAFQVIVVTHSPQVAAFGRHHFLVEKHTQNVKTHTKITALNNQQHQEEIARMLSGENITDAARLAARHLLEGKP